MPRKRNKRAEEGPAEDIFAALERHGTHNFQREPDEQPRVATKKEDQPDIQTLLGQINNLKGQVEDMTRRSYMAPASAPQQRQTQNVVRAQDVTLNLDGLPDPGLDINAYNRALQDRVNAVITARTTAARDEAIHARTAAENESSQARNLMSGFIGAHPEWAGKDDLIDMVAKRVVEREAARGMDVSRYVFGDPTLFYADVSKALQKDYAKLAKAGEDEGDDEGDAPQERGPAPIESPFSDDGRTAGILGGQESGGKPTPGRINAAPAKTMIDDLRDLQMKSGYYSWFLAFALTSGIFAVTNGLML